MKHAHLQGTIERLASEGFEIVRDAPLSGLGTFRLGGPAAAVVRVSDPGELARVRGVLSAAESPAVLIGEGSNLLFSDAGWPGVVVRFAEGNSPPESRGDGVWRVSAAMNLDGLSRWAAERGWTGLEAFTGIPGTVGGAVVGNAGAWGVQMEHVLREVRVVEMSGTLASRTVEACGFAYRDSALKHAGDWVAEVDLRLGAGHPEELLAERERILAERAKRHPDWRQVPCIGSFFRNLEPTSRAERRRAAGFFLESAGAKSFRVGGAGVFERHANIPVKRGAECRADDVAALARRMRKAVRKAHGIELEREVRYLGEIAGEAPAEGFH